MSMDWDRRFIDLADHVAQWSKDPSTKVGSVIVDDKRRIIGVGYNGFPRGVIDSESRLADRALKYPRVVHAEANAILNSIVRPDSATLYCTHPTCSECAKLVIQSGIRVVVYPREDPLGTRWNESVKIAWEMYREAGVICSMLP